MLVWNAVCYDRLLFGLLSNSNGILAGVFAQDI